MASLQARHSRSCGLRKPWTTFAGADKRRGCTCTPLYHVVLRHNGKLIREPVGHNRREAERALDARRGDLARREYRVIEDIRFDTWADQWLSALTGKESSRRAYAVTISYARQAFGTRNVREITTADVRRLLDDVREAQRGRTVSPATLAKHLRQLGACLQAALSEGYASANPVRGLHKSARPKVTKSRPAYYTDAELARLWPELAYRPVYVALCKSAVATGMRLGELAALEWSDIDLLNREIHVRKTYTEGVGITPPKSGDARTVDLTPPAATVLERWLVESRGDGLAFERDEGGHLSSDTVRKRVLYPALERAGIPRVGERGRSRDFHSFRHTFARIALEHGAEITWVQRQLGHSSITLTVDTYGAWARAAEKSQAEKLAKAFRL